MTASLQVVADPSIHPGGIVNINEYNSEFDGFWYVVSVRHELTQSYMVTHLELARDSLGTIDDAKKVSVAHKTPPNPALINDVWVSSKDYSDVYV
jgi:hypothetical protein